MKIKSMTYFSKTGLLQFQFRGVQRVKILKVLKEEDMALIKILDGPSDKGTKWWVQRSDITRKTQSSSNTKSNKDYKSSSNTRSNIIRIKQGQSSLSFYQSSSPKGIKAA